MEGGVGEWYKYTRENDDLLHKPSEMFYHENTPYSEYTTGCMCVCVCVCVCVCATGHLQ